MIHPTCMNIRLKTDVMKKCTDVIKNCMSDTYCNHRLPHYNHSCTVDSRGKCSAKKLERCRHSIMSIRGTFFETPCYCPVNDDECLSKQKMMIPNNPCIGS